METISAFMVLAFVGGSAFGAVAAWALCGVVGSHLRAALGAAQEAEKARSAELAAVRIESEEWRERLQAERLERVGFEAGARRAAGLEAEMQGVRAELAAAVAERAAARAQLQEQARAHAGKVALLTEVRGEIEKDLKAIAVEALRANQGSFVELASQIFERHRLSADADLEARQKAVESLVAPLRETLQGYSQHVDALERERVHAYGALSAEIKGVVAAQNAVRAETARLVNALRAAPKTRGRWGEQTLRNVLELSGLSAHCDFITEQSFAREDTLARPDVLIRLPGGRRIVVDAKTSLSAYLDAVEATDETERDRLLVLHARQLREHVRQLAAKSYWDLLSPAPDFVLMFVPGDNFYAAALERDPALFEDAAAQRVIIVTPATLIALAKAVAFGWRQEKVAENARAVHELGREIYRRLARMADHIGRCGDALDRSVKHYNSLVGSLEHSVMPQARRFAELEVEGTGAEIPLLAQVETQARALRPEAVSGAKEESAEAA
jgi:DNA recombination protein RmuC